MMKAKSLSLTLQAYTHRHLSKSPLNGISIQYTTYYVVTNGRNLVACMETSRLLEVYGLTSYG